ncbi:nuclear transport factor 2 family protein [Streptomyces sp. NPDC048717]|uniref:nuclear transport factor 2 family protein n=1 Tax=unclassified Streptomyces TaxID=2593676 RepID=UPI00343ACB72
MNVFETAVDRYLAAWNAPDSDTLVKAVADAWEQDGTYTDPLMDVRGHEQLVAGITAARQQFPGHEFKLTGTVDGHHDVARFTWDLVSTADGSSPAAGFDVIALSGTGRIVSVHGFLDRVPGA